MSGHYSAAIVGTRRPLGLLAPCLIVFFSGFCIMLIELVASQLVAGYIGRSLETWTAVIGVILAGISAGNYAGGLLADRYPSKQLAATLFILAAALSAAILALVDPVGHFAAGFGVGADANLKRILTVTFGVFFLPATLLGMISPAIVKWALDFGYATGRTVGTIYAWNTVGSILGTFATGYYLMSWFSVQTIVLVASAGLLAAGMSFLPSIMSGVKEEAVPDLMARTRVSAETDRAEWNREGLMIPSAIVFISGFVVMLVEIAAGRLVAGHIGQSIYTWTSVIGVILGGITLGNYCGGRLADRFDSKALVGSLLILSSMLVLTLLFSHLVIPSAMESWPTGKISWGHRVAIVCMAAFLLPSAALGTISPAVAKWALDRKYASGKTVGTIYAWNTIGSICGTFATGFVLVSMFYVSRLIAFSSLGLALIGILFLATGGTWVGRIVGCCWLAIALFAAAFVSVPANRFENTVIAFPRPALTELQRNKALEFHEHLAFLKDSHAALKKDCFSATAPASLKDDAVWSRLDAGYALLCEEALADLESKLWSSPELEIRQKMKRLEADLSNNGDGKSGEVDAKNAARKELSNLQRELDDSVRRRPKASEIEIAGSRLERSIFAYREALRELQRRALKADGDAADAAADELETMLGRMGQLASVFISRERSWLRFASKLFCRYEEINLEDQYDPSELLQYYDESNYFTLQVSERTEESKRLDDWELDENGNPRVSASGEKVLRDRKFRQLVLDALIHGYVDLSDYTYLHYEYEHIYASVSHRLMSKHRAAGQQLHVLFLGGGSYTFPRYLDALYPKDEKNDSIQCDIAEIDPRVTATVRRAMGMNKLKDKRVFLLVDDAEGAAGRVTPGELDRSQEPSVFGGLKALIVHSVFRKPTTRETHERFIRLIAEAGAVHVRSVDRLREKPADYAVDLRTDRSADAPGLAVLNERKTEILEPAKFLELMDTSPYDNIVTHHMDARQYIMQNQQKGQYDVVYGDAFNDFSVPSHLTTFEFNQKMSELLKEDGIFMANVIDKWQVSKFMGSYLHTLEQVFKHVYLLKDRRGDPGSSRDTFVIICSNKPVDLDDLGKRDEDVKGMVGSLMSPRLMKPVRRGGLYPPRQWGILDRGPLVFVGDGKETTFDLGMTVGEAAVRLRHQLDPSEFEITHGPGDEPGGQEIELDRPLPDGAKMIVKLTIPETRIRMVGNGDEWTRALPKYDAVVSFREPNSTKVVRSLGINWQLKADRAPKISFLERAKPPQPAPKADGAATGKAVGGKPKRSPVAPSVYSEVRISVTADPPAVEFTGDGKQTVFPLPLPKIEATWERLLDDRDLASMERKETDDEAKENAENAMTVAWKGPLYEIKDGRTLTFKEPPPANYQIVVQPYTTERIVLTDRYCPVDIMLAEVAQSRQRDEDE